MDAQRAVYWISLLARVHQDVAHDMIENTNARQLMEKYCMTADSDQVFLAYTFLGTLTYKVDDLTFIAHFLKPEIIKFQIDTVSWEAFNTISWTLCNILADDKCGEGLFEDLIKTKGFMVSLLNSLLAHTRTSKNTSDELLHAFLVLGNAQFLTALLNDFHVLSLVEAYLERGDSRLSLMTGLRLLHALFEKCNQEYSPRRHIDNPAVKLFLHNPHLVSLMEKITQCPFKSVYELANQLCVDYLPLDNS